jgi:crotonobetainyl-CoA:carnitine CoA-transferase CaiB-like acyl-CoA transferase
MSERTANPAAVPGPLHGVKVLELSIWGVGSLSGVILSDLGADVIKVESPLGDPGRQLANLLRLPVMTEDGRSAFFEIFNRGKRGIVLDLTREVPRKMAFELAAKVDVVTSNFRGGVLDRLGLSYEAVRAVNPKVVYATANGFGPHGPDRDRPGLEYTGQARSGYMWTMGGAEDPPMCHHASPSDIGGAGSLSQAVLAGLVRRGITGEGCHIEVSSFGAMLFQLQANAGAYFFMNASQMSRVRREEEQNPLANHYRCADGQWIVIGILQIDRQWPSLCNLIGRSELLEDPRFATGVEVKKHSEELIAILDDIFATKTLDDWFHILSNDRDLVFDRVQTLGDVRIDAQAIENEYLIEVPYDHNESRTMIRAPFHVNGAAPRATRRAPGHGEHTWDVLAEFLGYDTDQLTALALAGDL